MVGLSCMAMKGTKDFIVRDASFIKAINRQKCKPQRTSQIGTSGPDTILKSYHHLEKATCRKQHPPPQKTIYTRPTKCLSESMHDECGLHQVTGSVITRET